ncbi:MAG: N-acetyl-gamma-glutamyl-phosphate reductase [Planctomycetota bacterium]|jgi:N-acetyl-gamma-glutamyl-phosphate reductase|nr:N-acetyl-gamma-glutamyl-phosphate reductase [Planctomycetota bacterium]
MPRVKVIGATGYGGLGMVELLLGHPELQLTAIAAIQDVGKQLSQVWPYLVGYCDLPILSPDSPEFQDSPAEVVVAATPDGVGQVLAPRELAAGRRFLDYSGDFRFNSAELYSEYATRLGRDPRHKSADLLKESVYGLSETRRSEIATARLVGNPGCFAVSVILALAPAVREGILDLDTLVCDSKSGISGAGKKPTPAHHYPERYESMGAYRLAGHQHVMEIEEELSRLATRPVKITFTPQVVPLTRGMLSSVYGRLAPGVNQAKTLALYQEAYATSAFVRVVDSNQAVSTADVRESNRCILTVAVDERTGFFRVISHIDNLLKGQAGTALQNLNLMFGFPEKMGLDFPGSHP